MASGNPKNAHKPQDLRIAKRRTLVARLRVQGLTLQEIADRLDSKPEFKGTSIATLSRDCRAVEAEWRDRACEAIESHRARQLHELAEAKRSAWVREDFAALARFMKLEGDLLGTSMPVLYRRLMDLPDAEFERARAEAQGQAEGQGQANAETDAGEAEAVPGPVPAHGG